MKKKFLYIKAHPVALIVFCSSFLFMDSCFVLSATSALLLHEAAHLIVMHFCGIEKCTVELTPFGGMIDARSFEQQSGLKQFLCASAGGAANTGAAFLCLGLAPRTYFWYQFLAANVSLACVNVLPLWPLDGARMVCGIAACFAVERKVRKILLFITYFVGAFFIAVGLYGVWQGIINFSLLMLGPYLLYAAGTERIANGVRSLALTKKNIRKTLPLPAAVWIGANRKPSDQFGVFLAKMDPKQYGLYVHIDPVTNKIKKIWTEDEIREAVFSDPEIDTRQNIDKR